MVFSSNSNTINLSKLSHSVGQGGKKNPLDVLVVQRLLNGCKKKFSGRKHLRADGLYGPNTKAQIVAFQKEVVSMNKPDGLINVNGRTHKMLVQLLAQDYRTNQRYFAQINQKSNINTRHFITLYKKQYPHEQYYSSLESLLNKIMADPYITDLRWVAYMLATVKRECGATWKPIREWGKGKNKPYGKEIEVLDPSTKKTKKNIYYGRGYVQLTWDYNYKKAGEKLGLGDQIYLNPDDVLKENIAYKILSIGMRDGIFANASLAQFLSGKRTDYVGARKIINGSDHAVEIAKTAAEIESFLMAALVKYIDLLFPTTGRLSAYA